MKKIMLTYGALSGAIVIAAVIVGLQLVSGDEIPRWAEWLGYLVMLVALSVIFLGIKRYRDRDLGGVIKFGTAFLLGLGITAVASVVYVIAWEINLSLTDYAFADGYARSVIAAREADGASAAEMQAVVAEMEVMKERYANPLFRLPMTFLEIFPVGLLITLLSAAVLKNSRVLPAAA